MLRWRLLLGALVIAALTGLCIADHRASTPGLWLAPVLLLFGVLGLQEMLNLLAAAGIRPRRGVAHVGNLLVLAGPWAFWAVAGTSVATQSVGDSAGTIPASHLPLVAAGWAGLAFAVACLLVFLGEMARYEKPGKTTADIAGGIAAVAYVGLLLSFAVQLRMLWGVPALVAMIAVVKMGDTGAYTVGRLIGRHKMSPRISPGKTWEGAAGALLFSLATAWMVFRYFPSAQQPSSGPLNWAVFGPAVCIAGMLGDLAESLLKRDTGCKDSSTWLPGFGGILDMLDSILFAAPIAYLLYTLGCMLS